MWDNKAEQIQNMCTVITVQVHERFRCKIRVTQSAVRDHAEGMGKKQVWYTIRNMDMKNSKTVTLKTTYDITPSESNVGLHRA